MRKSVTTHWGGYAGFSFKHNRHSWWPGVAWGQRGKQEAARNLKNLVIGAVQAGGVKRGRRDGAR